MFTLADAQSAIRNKPEFVCNEREFGFVIDYNVAFAATFVGETERETHILQNLRGTCFSPEGKIIRLAFHKFHNLNENPEYAAEMFDFSEPHTIQVKLDGSMIAPIPHTIDGRFGYKLGTRAGVTEVSMKATNYLARLHSTDYRLWVEYDSLIRYFISINCTPIFEFCSREQRIVIDYPDTTLVLLSVRSNGTGEYIDARDVGFGGPKVAAVSNTATLTELAAAVRGYVGSEGVVIKFASGRFVKIKGDDYCLKHKALDGLRFEKDVLAMVLSGAIDDVLPLVDDVTKHRLERYNKSVWEHITKHDAELLLVFKSLMVGSPTRPEFATLVATSADTKYSPGLFKLHSGKQYSLKTTAQRGTRSSTELEQVRWLIGPSFYDFQ